MKSFYNCLSNQRGIATIFVPVFLLLAIVLGIYLVQNRTNIFPKAVSEPVGPETSFSLESNKKSVKIGETFTVDVLVRSDFDAANTFSALISYPADKLEVVGIEPPANPPNVSPSPTLKISQDEKPNFVSQVFDKFSTKAEAQAPAPMPVISGKTYCSGGKPVVELNWSKVQTSDNEYLFIKSPDGKSGVTVSTFFDRYQYPIKDTGFISPVNLNTAYTYYLESFGGQKSNSVTVTTPANCSTATPTPTPAPVCGAFCINGDKDCAGAKDGCIACVSLRCQVPATPTPFPSHSATPTPTPYPSQSAMPPAVCGRTCKTDDYCATAKDGCTSCLLNDAGTSYVCKPPAPTNLNFFIKKWVEQIDDKQGKVTLVGAVPNPGFKTANGQKGLMAKITFKAKANGEAGLDFIKEGTAIYRNSDNQNILGVTRGVKVLIGGVENSSIPNPSSSTCQGIACAQPSPGCSYQNGFTSTCDPAKYNELTCGNLICVGSPSPKPSAPSVSGKKADLFKDPNKPDFVNDQDISVFFSKCAEKGVELFGQPATVQPICDILEDGKITVSDWAVLIKFRNQSVAQ